MRTLYSVVLRHDNIIHENGNKEVDGGLSRGCFWAVGI